MFENVDGPMDHGTMESLVYYKLTHEPLAQVSKKVGKVGPA